MIRVILWNLFLFLLPFVLTALWGYWVSRTHPREANESLARAATRSLRSLSL